MQKRMPKFASGTQQLREKAEAASSPLLVAVQPDLVEPEAPD
jgi:hypothetical protein